MSAAEISDVQLDRLLGQVAPPAPPSADLAGRIAARALGTIQVRPKPFPIPRRHAPRRRAGVWSVVIAANLMAAAAAAASWDGQRFDFQRLADLPHRVAAALQHGHRHQIEHKQIAHDRVVAVAHGQEAFPVASAVGQPASRQASAATSGAAAAWHAIPRLPVQLPSFQRRHEAASAEVPARHAQAFHGVTVKVPMQRRAPGISHITASRERVTAPRPQRIVRDQTAQKRLEQAASSLEPEIAQHRREAAPVADQNAYTAMPPPPRVDQVEGNDTPFRWRRQQGPWKSRSLRHPHLGAPRGRRGRRLGFQAL